MKIAVAKEIDPSEPRVAASPDTVKKYKELGVDIAVEPGAGLKSGLPDSEVTGAGAPVIRPGRSTAEYLGKVMGRITLAGALFLAVITVVLPLLTAVLTGVPSTSLYLGGTAILIVVGVALDTMKQIETQLLMRQYKGFIK